MVYNGCRFGEAIALRPENIKEEYIEIHGTLDYMTSGYENSTKTNYLKQIQAGVRLF